MRTCALLLAASPLVLEILSGCARTAEERQLDNMRVDIDRLQDERDRVERSDIPQEPTASTAAPRATGSVANGSASRSSSDPASGGPAAPAAAPPADDNSDDYADPEDTTPRPRIRVVGSPRPSGHEFEQVDDGTASSSDPARAHVLDPEAKTAYDAAMSLVGAKKYDAALDALAAFLVRWPDHPYADHAMYWRGECYFARGDYRHASDQFEGGLARFPAGAKVPDALFKLGMAQQRLGESAKAKESFDRLARDFPQSDAARRLVATAGGGSAQ